MYIVHNTKVDNLIKDYNRRIALKKGDSDFPAFMRRIIISLILNQNDKTYRGIEKVAAYMKENSYLERYENWLKKYQLYTVSFDEIVVVLINTEIKIPGGQGLTGYAMQYDNKYYALVNDTEELENTISILTHEIMHAELESLLRRIKQEGNMEIQESVKEELVVILEHTFLLDEMQIKARDIQMEKVRLFQRLLQSDMEEVIAQWIQGCYTEKQSG